MRSHPAQNSSYAQLPQEDLNESDPDPLETTIPPDKMLSLSRRGLLRTYWLAATLCCAGALFGYDSGVIGSFPSVRDTVVEADDRQVVF